MGRAYASRIADEAIDPVIDDETQLQNDADFSVSEKPSGRSARDDPHFQAPAR